MTSIVTVAEGAQAIRRGEGLVFQLTTTNWGSSPTPSDISITASDGTDMTGAWTSTATPTVASDVITLPEITIPSAATLGRYRVDVPFTTGGFSPGIARFDLLVVE